MSNSRIYTNAIQQAYLQGYNKALQEQREKELKVRHTPTSDAMTIEDCIDTLNEEWDFAQQPCYVKVAIEQAVSAMKKQIPQKPIKTKKEWVCPTCKTLVGSRPYCGYCGQRIEVESIK